MTEVILNVGGEGQAKGRTLLSKTWLCEETVPQYFPFPYDSDAIIQGLLASGKNMLVGKSSFQLTCACLRRQKYFQKCFWNVTSGKMLWRRKTKSIQKAHLNEKLLSQREADSDLYTEE